MANITKKRAEEVLELTSDYTKTDLKRAFARQARYYHPDVAKQNGIDEENATDLMIEVNAAFKCLSALFKDDPKAVITPTTSDHDDYDPTAEPEEYYDDEEDHYEPEPQQKYTYRPDNSRTEYARQKVDEFNQKYGYQDIFEEWRQQEEAAKRQKERERKREERENDPNSITYRVDSMTDRFFSNPIVSIILNPTLLKFAFAVAIFLIWRRIGQFEPFSWDSPLLDKSVYEATVEWLLTTAGYFAVPILSIWNFVTGKITNTLIAAVGIVVTVLCYPIAIIMKICDAIRTDDKGKKVGEA